MKEQIIQEIENIEKIHNVTIVYACESGSRAWGFPSQNSDYDVRFIYVRPRDWYLSVNLEQMRDVIEIPINNELDINGWDLRKALQLFKKSNPPLIEWLGSPIVYQEKTTVAQQMRQLSQSFYNPIACSYHYLHMAQGNYRDYLKGGRIRVKKYFYVLRPLLAIQWLEQNLGVVPTEFGIMVDRLLPEGALKTSIHALIEAKQGGAELDEGPRIPEISDFIEEELNRLQSKQFEAQIEKQSFEPLNQLFRAALTEVWEA